MAEVVSWTRASRRRTKNTRSTKKELEVIRCGVCRWPVEVCQDATRLNCVGIETMIHDSPLSSS